MLANEPSSAPRIVVVLVLASLLAFFAIVAGASAAAPPNDDFANAVVLPAKLPVQVSGNDIDATVEIGEPAFSNGSVWYRWTAPGAESVTADTCVGSDFLSRLAVYQGTAPVALHQVAVGVDHGGCPTPAVGSSVSFDAAAGATYSIQVSGESGQTGSFGLNLTGFQQVGAVTLSIPDHSSTQVGRLNRSEHRGSCAAPNVPTQFQGPPDARARVATGLPSSSLDGAACLRVETKAPGCDGATDPVIAAVYAGAFDPANIAANLIGAAADSGGASQSFEFPVQPATAMTLVASEISPEGTCPTFGVSFSADRPWASARPTLTANGVDSSARAVFAGEALSARPATWIAGSSSVGLQWRSCRADGSGCIDIPGATGPTFTPALGQVGRTLRVVDTAANPLVTTLSSSSSAATGPVAAESTKPRRPIAADAFQFGKLTRDLRHGSARLGILVPGPGKLALSGANVVRAPGTAKRAGMVVLAVRTKGAALAGLRKTGRAKLRVAVKFTPMGGQATTAKRRIELRLKHPQSR